MHTGRILMVAVLVALAGAARPGGAQDWLPPAVVDGLSQQLYDRLAAIEEAPDDDPAEALGRVRDGVLRLRAAVDDWGDEGVFARAPSFGRLDVPRSGQRHLDAMARYQLCNAMLIRQLLEEEDAERQRVAMIGVTGLTVAIMFLRDPFITQGGSHAQIESFLTSEAMEREFTRIQQSRALRDHVDEACAPTVATLIERFVD